MIAASSAGFFHACPILIAVRLTNARLDSKIPFDVSLFSVVFISNSLTFHHSRILCHKKRHTLTVKPRIQIIIAFRSGESEGQIKTSGFLKYRIQDCKLVKGTPRNWRSVLSMCLFTTVFLKGIPSLDSSHVWSLCTGWRTQVLLQNET